MGRGCARPVLGKRNRLVCRSRRGQIHEPPTSIFTQSYFKQHNHHAFLQQPPPSIFQSRSPTTVLRHHGSSPCSYIIIRHAAVCAMQRAMQCITYHALLFVHVFVYFPSIRWYPRATNLSIAVLEYVGCSLITFLLLSSSSRTTMHHSHSSRETLLFTELQLGIRLPWCTGYLGAARKKLS